MQRAILTVNGRNKSAWPSRTASRRTDQSCAQSGRRLAHATSSKSYASMDIGRSAYPGVRRHLSFGAHPIHSERMGMERRAQQGARRPEPDANVKRVSESDDESSVIAKPRKDVSCGACRTRESKVWMKGPKALIPSSLCEACGMKWRKYADLKQEEAKKDEAPEKEKEKEKGKKRDREGTPVQGNAKRAKVRRPFLRCTCVDCE